MLQVNRINKRLGSTQILTNITFSISKGERVGLVGANGCGKTTLLEILAGRLPPDSGSVITGSNETIGYMPQNPLSLTGGTIRERLIGCINPLQTREMESRTAEALRILAGLGLASQDLQTPLERLSGGEQTRTLLAQLLLDRPDILLLDEPTNHLDIPALEWLEEFVNRYPGIILLVSHDRVFLDRTVQCIYEIDDLEHTIRKYPGNYSDYAATKEQEKGKLYRQWKDQQVEIKRLKSDWKQTVEQARWTESKTRDSTTRRYAKKVAKKAKAKEKRLERFLEASERTEKPMDRWRLRVNFAEPSHQSAMILETHDLSFAYDRTPIIDELSLTIANGERIALTGANGSGKSTLLKLLLRELSPASGTIRWGNSVVTGYMPQKQDTLDPDAKPLTVIENARPMALSETYHFLHYFLLNQDQANLPTRMLSYGQRARLLLARLVAQGANFLVLDEPINHLDIPSRQQFELALEAFSGGVLLVAHDRAFIQRVTTKTWILEEGHIRQVYSDTPADS